MAADRVPPFPTCAAFDFSRGFGSRSSPETLTEGNGSRAIRAIAEAKCCSVPVVQALPGGLQADGCATKTWQASYFPAPGSWLGRQLHCGLPFQASIQERISSHV